MTTEPLEKFAKKINDYFSIETSSTACHRGYIATWEIKENKLYLIFITGLFEAGSWMKYIFPRQSNVLADWFSEEIQLPLGKELKYIHAGYESIYEKDLFLEILNGILVNTRLVDNSNKIADEGSKIAKEKEIKSFWKKLSQMMNGESLAVIKKRKQ